MFFPFSDYNAILIWFFGLKSPGSMMRMLSVWHYLVMMTLTRQLNEQTLETLAITKEAKVSDSVVSVGNSVEHCQTLSHCWIVFASVGKSSYLHLSRASVSGMLQKLAFK